MSESIIYNGRLISKEEFGLSYENRALMYGDGFFDTFRSYKGKFLHLEKHFERILETTQYLGINVHFGFEDFKFKILELLEATNLKEVDSLVRVQCWRDGGRGYLPESREAHWITSCEVISDEFKELISLSSVSTRTIPSMALERRFKLSNGLNYILAAREANELGSDDALMFSTKGAISETTIANIFWIKGSQIFTPSVECDLLPGITRSIIIEIIAESEGLECIEGDFVKEDILSSEAVFCTNSLREIRLVHNLDDKSFDTNHTTLRTVKAEFEKYKHQELS